MPDPGDLGSAAEEVDRARALAYRKPVLTPCGFCYNCGEPIPGVYCDKDCESDHLRRCSR